MTNPVIHALVVLAAIIIPGGLVVYFAWRFKARCNEAKEAQRQKDPIEEIREAFLSRYPKDSLRAKARRERLAMLHRRRRKNSPK
jgi:hypothetical protein